MTITKKDLINQIKTELNIPIKDAELLFNEIIQEISQGLERGESIKCANFGTFNISDRPDRVGRHPITGQEIKIKSSRNTYFKASSSINGKLNKVDLFM